MVCGAYICNPPAGSGGASCNQPATNDSAIKHKNIALIEIKAVSCHKMSTLPIYGNVWVFRAFWNCTFVCLSPCCR